MVDNIFDFTGIDVKIADEVYEAFNEVFKKFPNLKNRINYVGSIENAFDVCHLFGFVSEKPE